jgi:hypothetical protein
VSENSPKFDPTINLGHVITLSGVVLAIVASYYSFSSRLTSVEFQINRIASVLESTIRQEEQVKSLNQRMDRLEARK